MLVLADPRTKPTHAGGLVYRLRKGRPEFLLVTAKRARNEWVFPKGHLEKGETSRDAAIREVAEEAGADARVTGALRDLVYDVGGTPVRVRYFLMRAQTNGEPCEGRRLEWVSPAEALRRIRFKDTRALVNLAVRALIARKPAARSRR